MYVAKPRKDGLDGTNIKCDVCRLPLAVSNGYYTCTQNCNYDMCKECFNQTKFHKIAFQKVCGYICERYFEQGMIILGEKPWVDGSRFSVYDISESESRLWIRLRSDQVSDLKLKFEDKDRKHKYKVAELIENYLKD